MSDAPCEESHLPESEAAARRRRLLPSRTVDIIADTFGVLGDPSRVRILDALSVGELCVCDIAALVGISESAVSHQLRLLRGMRLVRARRAGRQVFYSVDDQHIVQLLRLAVTHVREAAAVEPAGPAAHGRVESTSELTPQAGNAFPGHAR
jgi:DNA-binding transcriptional ArsR family regulator